MDFFFLLKTSVELCHPLDRETTKSKQKALTLAAVQDLHK